MEPMPCLCTTSNRIPPVSNLILDTSPEELEFLLESGQFKGRLSEGLVQNISEAKSTGELVKLHAAKPTNAAALRELCLWNAFVWENGRTITVKFLSGEKALQQKIQIYAKEWEVEANISFDFVPDGDADIRIRINDDMSAWSLVGKSCLDNTNQGEPTMNFGSFVHGTLDNEIRRVTLHEFGHALGCIHEHQHPAASIPWNTAVIRRVYTASYKWTEEQVQRNIFDRLPPSELSNSQYDPHSIMHYYFGPEFSMDGRPFHINYDLSLTDKSFIRTRYPGR